MGSTLKHHREKAVANFGETSSAVMFLDEKIKECGEDSKCPTEDNLFVPMLALLDLVGRVENNVEVSASSGEEFLEKLLSRAPIPILKRAFEIRLEDGEKLLNKAIYDKIESPRDFAECLSVLVGVHETKRVVEETIEVLTKVSTLTDKFSESLSSALDTYKGSLPFFIRGNA